MTHTFSITYRQTSLTTKTIALNAWPFLAVEFSGATPELRSDQLEPTGEDGMVLLYARQGLVTDQIKVLVCGDTLGQVDANIAQLEAIFDFGNRKLESVGEPIYLNYAAHADQGVWRTKIYSGKLASDPEHLIEPVYKIFAAEHAAKFFTVVTIQFTREWYWEGTQTTLTIYSKLTAANTTIPLNPVEDADQTCVLKYSATAVKGSLPTPAKITMQFPQQSSPLETLQHFHIAGDARFDEVTNFNPTIEIETPQSWSTTPSSINNSDVNASNGKSVSWNIADAHASTRLAIYTLSDSIMRHANGRWFHVILRGNPGSVEQTDAYVRLIFRYEGLILIQETGWVPLNNGDSGRGLTDLGLFKMPYQDYDTMNGSFHANIDMELWVQREGAWIGTLDCFEFIPAEDADGYSYLTAPYYGLQVNSTLVLDGITKTVRTKSGTMIGSHYLHIGTWPLLYPNRAGAIILLFDGNKLPSTYVNTTVEYRPRRMRV
jgi:hypothetical protein